MKSPMRWAVALLAGMMATPVCAWCESQQSGQHQSYQWHELYAPANIPNWLLVCVGAWAGCMALGTLDQIRKQANAQMDADRAWVLASVAGQPQEPLAQNLSQGIIPGIVWQLQIVGNTPARIIRADFRCRIVDPIPNMVYKPMLEATPVYLPNQGPEGEVISPPGEKQLF